MKKFINIKPFQLFWIAVIIAAPLLGACQKEGNMDDDQLECPVTPKEGPDDSVIGKWKLVKAHQEFAPTRQEPQDYSCDNVIYHFKEDDILTISGVQKGMISRSNGEYVFEFKDNPAYDGMDGYTIQIGNINSGCTIQDNRMVLDSSPLDGPRRYFVRVE